MPKTISFHNGTEWCRGHNIRDERYTSKQEHIDSSLSANNIVICDEPVRQAYDKIFGQAVQDYNARQERKDRRIDCYYNKIKHDKRKHPVYECIVQIGDKNDTGNTAELEKQALIRFAQTWKDRNPNLYLLGAYIHCDEPDGTVHLHCDYIPVAKCSNGMSVQNSLNKALQQQGLKSTNINQTAQMSWQTQERNALMSICNDLNINAQLNQERTKGRQHLTTSEYKAERKRLEHEIEQELQPLRDELQEYTDIKRDFQDISVQTTKIPLVKKVVVSESDLQEVENQAKSYRAVRQQLEKIEIREETVAEKESELEAKELELAEREKSCQEFETAFEKNKQALELAEKTIKDFSLAISIKNEELKEKTTELKEIGEEREKLVQKCDTLKRVARNDCCFIRDFAIAMKMLLFSENTTYKANLTEEQANLLKSMINIAKRLIDKHKMPQAVDDIENKCEISTLILSEMEKLTPPKNQPMFSLDRIKSDEFKPTSTSETNTQPPISRGIGR